MCWNHWSLRALEPILRNNRSLSYEKPTHHKEEDPPLTTTRESLVQQGRPTIATKQNKQTNKKKNKKKTLRKDNVCKYLLFLMVRSMEQFWGFPEPTNSVAQMVKKCACTVGDLGSIPGLGRSLGEGHGILP